MCGQFAVLGNLKAIKDYYEFLKKGDFIIDENEFYNPDLFSDVALPNPRVLPMSFAPIITCNHKKIYLQKARWGLVPFWAKDESFAVKMINARVETLSEKPSFKYAYKDRRCLIPFSGFYERDSKKNLHYFPNHNEELQSFAGLYEVWGNERLITFTIITSPADEKVVAIPPRMPVVMGEATALQWLNNSQISSS